MEHKVLNSVSVMAIIEELRCHDLHNDHEAVKALLGCVPTSALLVALNGCGTTSQLDTATMLGVIAMRGGHPGVLAEAALLCIEKSKDYNHGKGQDVHNVDRSNYFPLGLASYAQMIHTKSERLLSLVRKGEGAAVFESAHDTCLDLVNYAGFAADHLKREAEK